MHRGKEPEAHRVGKGRLSCDSNAPKVGGARCGSTSVVELNRHKTNRRKTRPCCIYLYTHTHISHMYLSLTILASLSLYVTVYFRWLKMTFRPVLQSLPLQ